MNMPLLSVVIPTWNRAHIVCEAIESALSQRIGQVEVIVVDDGSTDNTVDVLAKNFGSRIRFLQLPRRRGAGAARNAGVALASGKLIAFLDSDDLWYPRFLETTTDYLNRYPDLALVCTAWRTLPNGHQKPEIQQAVLHGNLYSLLMVSRFIRLSAVVARKKVVLDVGAFDERLEMAENLDLWLRIARRYPMAFLNIPLSWGRKPIGDLAEKKLAHLGLQLQIIEAHYDPALLSKRRFDRHRSTVHLALARCYFQLGRLKEATRHIRRAVGLNPYSFRAHRYLLKALGSEVTRSVRRRLSAAR